MPHCWKSHVTAHRMILIIKKNLTQWIENISEIDFTLGQKFLSYPCYLTQAVTCGLFIGCIGTLTHGRQMTSTLSQSDVM